MANNGGLCGFLQPEGRRPAANKSACHQRRCCRSCSAATAAAAAAQRSALASACRLFVKGPHMQTEAGSLAERILLPSRGCWWTGPRWRTDLAGGTLSPGGHDRSPVLLTALTFLLHLLLLLPPHLFMSFSPPGSALVGVGLGSFCPGLVSRRPDCLSHSVSLDRSFC